MGETIRQAPKRAGNAAAQGLKEAAVLAAGYASEIGLMHVVGPLSFIYDAAALLTFETVVPVAFEIAGKTMKGAIRESPDRAVRRAWGLEFRAVAVKVCDNEAVRRRFAARLSPMSAIWTRTATRIAIRFRSPSRARN